MSHAPSIEPASTAQTSTGELTLAPERPLSAEELAVVLRVTLRVGVLMASAGAAAFRVRDTMRRTAASFGVTQAELVYGLDALHVSLSSGERFRTKTVRVKAIGVDMNRICRLELLSRDLLAEPGRRTVEALDALLSELEATPPVYPRWLTGPLLGASCGAFCAVIGGTPWQVAAAFVGTYVGHLLRLHHLKTHPPVATIVVTCAFTSALVSWATARGLHLAVEALSLGVSEAAVAPGKAVLASVLYLIPGVPLVNSLIDLLHFDLVAGVARGAFATLVIVCIAVGVLAFLSLTGFALT